MPRGPGKKSNYNLDYSRFNYLDSLEDDAPSAVAKSKPVPVEKESRDDDAPMPDMSDLLRNMPPELQHAYHLMSIAKQSGDEGAMKRANELALKAVEHGGPEVKKNFISNLTTQMPELGERLGEELTKVTDDPTLTAEQIVENLMKEPPKPKQEGNFDERVAGLKKTMEASADSAKQQLDNLAKQQEQLEKLQNPEDLMKFMFDGGMSQADLQRILTGDTAHMEECFKGMLDRTACPDASGNDLAKADEAVKAAETLHDNICGRITEIDDLTADIGGKKAVPTSDGHTAVQTKPIKVVHGKPAAPAPPVREVTIPDYRLQYQKDDNGKYAAVELRCTLPGVADMSAIQLDVSREHLRLSTREPAPGYAVNAGPFPVPINPSAARAKYSKKREELLITVAVETVA